MVYCSSQVYLVIEYIMYIIMYIEQTDVLNLNSKINQTEIKMLEGKLSKIKHVRGKIVLDILSLTKLFKIKNSIKYTIEIETYTHT